MKKKMHCDLIIAWAKGHKIQRRTVSGSWRDCSNPTWSPRTSYRVKPREFKIGACYPAITSGNKDKVLVTYLKNGEFNLNGGTYEEGDFVWVGEQLSNEIWEGSDA